MSNLPAIQPVSGTVAVASHQKATYVVNASAYTAYATPTDLVCIAGSASKLVRVTAFYVQAEATAAGQVTYYWVKRTKADSGGAFSAPTAASYDSANGSATAAVMSYTSSPTLGAAAGSLRILPGSVVATSAAGGPSMYSVFSANAVLGNADGYQQSITLHGAGEELCLNFNGAALPAGYTSWWTLEWTEE